MSKPAVKTGTPGQEKLLAITKREGKGKISQERLAEQIGASQQSISRWAAGSSRPSMFWRARMRKVLRIPVRDWLTQRERAELREAA